MLSQWNVLSALLERNISAARFAIEEWRTWVRENTLFLHRNLYIKYIFSFSGSAGCLDSEIIPPTVQQEEIFLQYINTSSVGFLNKTSKQLYYYFLSHNPPALRKLPPGP